MFYKNNIELIKQKTIKCFEPYFISSENKVIKDVSLDINETNDFVWLLVDNIKINNIQSFAFVIVDENKISVSFFIDNDKLDDFEENANIYMDSTLNDTWKLNYDASDTYGFEICYTYVSKNIDLLFEKAEKALSVLKEHSYELGLLYEERLN